MAARTVHWLMLEETMFMRAIGAWRTVAAHLKADTFSGNSERKGATHWMNTNSLIPAARAMALRLSTKGWVTKERMSPPPRHRPEMAGPPTPGPKAITFPGTQSTSEGSSSLRE